MITPNDEQSLKRMLGGEIPEGVRAECELRTSMYHRAGATGDLGPQALINVIRHCGCKPPDKALPPQRVEWRKYPVDGSTRIEAYYFGQWKPGRFYGFVANGTLDIVLDNDTMHRECRPAPEVIRLATCDTVSQTDPVQEASPKAKLLELAEKSAAILDDAKGDHLEPAVAAPQPETVEAEFDIEDDATETDWAKCAEGAKVYVEDEADGDFLDGEFLGPGKVDEQGEYFRVRVDGQERQVLKAKLTHAG